MSSKKPKDKKNGSHTKVEVVELKATDSSSREAKMPAIAIEPAHDDFRVRGGPMRVLSDMPRSFGLLEKRYVENLYQMLGYVYEVASFLRDDEAAWSDFIDDPAWNGVKGRPMQEDRSGSLKSVLRIAVGLRDDAASKMASKYWAALAEPFRRKIAAEHLREFIVDGGGIENLVQLERRRRRSTVEVGGIAVNDNTHVGDLELLEQMSDGNGRFSVRFFGIGITTTVTVERNGLTE